jgi:hypothetical protein
MDRVCGESKSRRRCSNLWYNKVDIARISIKGRVRINTCTLVVDEDNVKVLEMDFHTKNADSIAYGSSEGIPSIAFGYSENTLYLDDGGEITEVEFPRFKGFSVIAADLGRYSCFVVLLKDDYEQLETVWFDKED